MNILKKPSWLISENEVTPESLFNARRHFLKLGAATIVASGAISETLAKVNLSAGMLDYKKDKILKAWILIPMSKPVLTITSMNFPPLKKPLQRWHIR